ncbi:MAG: thioredoxin family protein [Patescibacteria group bacterium]|nr:thioredoxin family protein [Patescibacteria group bacterium]
MRGCLIAIELCALIVSAAIPQPTGQVALIEFVQPSCRPCREMAPIVERLEREGTLIIRLDARTDAAVSVLGVTKTPAFFAVTRTGREAGRINGSTTEIKLRALVRKAESKE